MATMPEVNDPAGVYFVIGDGRRTVFHARDKRRDTTTHIPSLISATGKTSARSSPPGLR